MAQIVVKTELVHRWGKSVNIDGIIFTFNSEGVAEVENLTDQIQSHLSDYNVDIINTETTELKKSDLEKFKKDELINLAKESGLPEADFISLNKEDLINYLIEKVVK